MTTNTDVTAGTDAPARKARKPITDRIEVVRVIEVVDKSPVGLSTTYEGGSYTRAPNGLPPAGEVTLDSYGRLSIPIPDLPGPPWVEGQREARYAVHRHRDRVTRPHTLVLAATDHKRTHESVLAVRIDAKHTARMKVAGRLHLFGAVRPRWKPVKLDYELVEHAKVWYGLVDLTPLVESPRPA